MFTCNNGVSQDITRDEPVSDASQVIVLFSVANKAASDEIDLNACNETSDVIDLLRIARRATFAGIVLDKVASRAASQVTDLALVWSKATPTLML